MLTCCPACETRFRVTPEQLKVRSGKVRCGKCQTIFNALDSLLEATAQATATPPATASPPVAAAAGKPTAHPAATPVPARSASPSPIARGPSMPAPSGLSALPDTLPPPAAPVTPVPPATAGGAVAQIDAAPRADTGGEPDVVETPPCPEEVRDAAITHGLVAVRETSEIPGYNKWAEGALTAPVALAEPPKTTRWPAVLATLLLLLALAGQAAYHFRSELAIAAPTLRPLLDSACAALACDIPLPRHTDQVSIEASDLQADPAQGGALVLTATLKNRAPYAQAWPLLELTLTDVQDSAVLRRVLSAADYLPAKADPTLFPPNGEVAVRLWLGAKEVGAAGYRLYVFYP